MDSSRSSRHSKITGDFGENLVLYLLSKHGFECAHVDHTGIDIIARNPVTKEVMGISVKSRSRQMGKEKESITLVKGNDTQKIIDACKAFGCVPYFAVVADVKDKVLVFLLSQKKLLHLSKKGLAITALRMTPKKIEEYYRDADIKVFEFTYKKVRFW